MALYYQLEFATADSFEKEIRRQIMDELLHAILSIDPDGWAMHKDNHSYIGGRGYLVYLTKLLHRTAVRRRIVRGTLSSPWLTVHGVLNDESVLDRVADLAPFSSVKHHYVQLDPLSQLADMASKIDIKDADARDLFEADTRVEFLLYRCFV